jgi:hypothetical protein
MRNYDDGTKGNFTRLSFFPDEVIPGIVVCDGFSAHQRGGDA